MQREGFGRTMENLFQEPGKLLKELDSFDFSDAAIDAYVNRLTLEITKYCSVGCSHCKYNAPLPHKSRKNHRLFFSKEAVNSCVKYLNEHSVESLVLTGGGEPTHELESLSTLSAETKVKFVSIYTAGNWGSEHDFGGVFNILERSIKSSRPKKKIEIRLSADDFHRIKIGHEPYLRIIQKWQQEHASSNRILMRIRTIRGHDEIVDRIAQELGARLDSLSESRRILITPDGTQIEIDSFNLIPMGRINFKHEGMLPDKNVWENLELIRDMNGVDWPVKYGGGLNIGVRPSGKVYLYGSSPESFGKVQDEPLADIIKRITSEPISIVLVRYGLTLLVKALSECAPTRMEQVLDTSEPSIVIPKFCSRPDELLLAKLVSLQILARMSQSAASVVKSLGLNAVDGGGTFAEISAIYRKAHDDW